MAASGSISPGMMAVIPKLAVIRNVSSFHGIEFPSISRRRVSATCCAPCAGVWKENQELLSSIPALQIAATQHRIHSSANSAEYRVTGKVAIPIVDRPEVVEVKYDQRHRQLRTARAAHLGLEDPHAVATRYARGERIPDVAFHHLAEEL